MSTIAPRHDQIDFRLSPQQKELLEQAAATTGQSLTDFATTTLLEKAREVLRLEHALRLSERDARRFLELLDADTEPNEALTNAARRYRGCHG
jgi:uncharacterized protein (DUF1778 family)